MPQNHRGQCQINRVNNIPRVTGVELTLPPGQQSRGAFSGCLVAARFVAQIVGPAAKRIDRGKVWQCFIGYQGAQNGEVLVVAVGEFLAIALGYLGQKGRSLPKPDAAAELGPKGVQQVDNRRVALQGPLSRGPAARVPGERKLRKWGP